MSNEKTMLLRPRQCSVTEESVFGPRVSSSCNEGFDFTLLFEETILTIVPVVITCILLTIRVRKLQGLPVKINRSWLYIAKLFAHSVYIILQLVLLGLWNETIVAIKTSASIPTTIVTAIGFAFFLYVSHLEHLHSLRPCTILNLYLLCSLLFDVVRARTLWLVGTSQSVAGVSSAACGLKAVILILEATEKRWLLKDPFKQSTMEATGGIYSRSLFWWLNDLLWKGFNTLFTIDSLGTLDDEIAAAASPESLTQRWNNVANKSRSYALLWTFFVHYKWHILAGTFPRLAYIGFNFAQPFLIQRVLDFMDEPENANSHNVAYGLIGAYAIVYIGIAISGATYEHKTYRVITMIRGSLVSLIFDKTLQIQAPAVVDAEAITLMSADVQRIGTGLRELHELYSSLIELSLALWLLERLLHVAMVASTVFVIACLLAGIPLAIVAGNAQEGWLEAIEKRIAVTSKVLGAMKEIKMTGFGSLVTSIIHALRMQEIKSSRAFRVYDVFVVVMSYASAALAPVFGFGVYILYARAHHSTTLTDSIAFSALTLFSLLETPLVTLIHGGRELVTVANCFHRIQEYISSPERADFRFIESQRPGCNLDPDCRSSVSPQVFPPDNNDSEKVGTSNCAELRNVSCSWSNKEGQVLKDLSLTIANKEITMLVGPVGCGKSSFLQLLLGEIPEFSGSLTTSYSQAAYCSQSPWLTFGTIQENIVGSSPWDRSWYDRVIQACALDVDLQSLTEGDKTQIGPRGSRLSGGQKLRVALARAVYSKKEVLILDNVLTGVDNSTENHILQALFGPDGIFKKGGQTVVFATTSARHLVYADSILVFDANGRVERSSYQEYGAKCEYLSDSAGNFEASYAQASSAVLNDDILQVLHLDENETHQARRKTGDWTIYKYYFRNVGWIFTGLYMACAASFVFGLNFPQIWVQWWTEANAKQPNENIGYWLGIFAALGVLNLGLAALTDWLFTMVIVPRTARRFHSILLDTIMRATTTFLTTTQTGNTLNRFSQDLELIDMDLPSSFDLTITSFLSCIVEGILVFTGSSSYVLIAIPGCVAVMYMIQKFYLRTSRQLRLLDIEAKAPLHSQFLEVLQGLPSIRSYGWTEDYKRRSRIALNTSQRPYYLLFCIQRWLQLVLSLMVAAVAILVVSLAVTLLRKSSTNFLGVALFNIVNFGDTLQQLITQWTQLETAIGAVSRIRAFTQNTEVEDLDGETETVGDDWPKEGGISYINISASYEKDSELVLRNIDMKINPGEKIAICGRTGSGKSTLISTLVRMLEITNGTILIDGVDISKLPRFKVRTSLNTITQEPLFLHGTVRLNADPFGKSSDSDHKIIRALEKVRLWETIKSKGGLGIQFTDDLLTHGQKQLFCLARALCNPNSIVIMDEITSSVDSETVEFVHGLLKSELWHKTIIFVVHKLDNIMDFDKVAMMEKGHLLEFDSPRRLLEREDSFFRALFESAQPTPKDEQL